MKILQIVPYLPPSISGVGDYAYLLAQEFAAQHGIRTRFLVCDPAWVGGSELGGFSVAKLTRQSSDELCQRLSAESESPTVLLHYVGYGYQKRGCPLWLLRGLRFWQAASQGRKVVTMFHELSAFGPVWTSSFWTSPLQKWIAKHLCDLSESCQTNLRKYAQTLETLAPRHHARIRAFPVFSNVGEPSDVSALQQRRRQLVVFGSSNWRREVYTRYIDTLIGVCETLKVERLVDIGEATGTLSSLPFPVAQLGLQSPQTISDLLLESRFGFLTYFDGYLAKSGIFAAYSAHGLVPILPEQNSCEVDGIKAGREYLIAGAGLAKVSEAEMQTVADKARAWYGNHSLQKTAGTLAGLLAQNPTPAFAC